MLNKGFTITLHAGFNTKAAKAGYSLNISSVITLMKNMHPSLVFLKKQL